ncbi:MAG: serine hydrolase domain-containing protein [Acidimicrobiia bacterium]
MTSHPHSYPDSRSERRSEGRLEPPPDTEVHHAIDALVADQCAAGQHLGVQVAALWDGELVVDVARGWLDAERTRPVGPDSLFCCFSVTKALAAFEVWALLDAGRIGRHQPLAELWPGFRAPVTVEQVLTHQGGLHRVPQPLTTELLTDDRAGLEWVAALEPAWPPGSAAGYHTLTYGWLVRGLLEAATGEPFPAVLGPDVFVGLPATDRHRAAGIVEADGARGLPWLDLGAAGAGSGPTHPAAEAMPPAFVPDWNHPAMRAARQPAFSGWSSARALATHVDRLPARRVVEGARLVVDGVDRCLEVPVRRGLGVELGGRFEGGAVGALGPHPHAFGHGGHGGQVVVRDPRAGLTIAVLVNLLPAPELAAERTTTVCEVLRGLTGAG